MKRVLLQEAYCLHRRAYRETSFLVDFMTPDYGRFTAVAKAARKAKSTSLGLLQPFTPLFISWYGSGELVTLTQVDLKAEAKRLQGEALYAGFYLNELLMRLIPRWDAHPKLYMAYERTLMTLGEEGLAQKTLRRFEKFLLEELGYGLLPVQNKAATSFFIEDQYYQFIPEQGWVADHKGSFLGKNLLAIANDDWQLEETLHTGKRLMRMMIGQLLGSQTLQSRELFLGK